SVWVKAASECDPLLDARARSFFPTPGEAVIPHASRRPEEGALVSDLELEPDPVPDPDPVRNVLQRVPVTGIVRVSFHAKHPEAQALVEAEKFELRGRDPGDQPAAGPVPDPGNRARHQPCSEALPPMTGDHREAAKLADPVLALQDLGVTDGPSGPARHMHHPLVEVLADRQERVVRELEQRPETAAASLVEDDPDGLFGGRRCRERE